MGASNINTVVVTGNLTRDPELRSTPNGTSVCKMRVAVNSRRKDGASEWVDKPNYFDVTVWGAQGENCANYLSKGRPVAVEGASTGASGRRKTAPSASQLKLSPIASSSSAHAATTPAAAMASSRARTFRPTPRTSRARRPAPAARLDDDIPF